VTVAGAQFEPPGFETDLLCLACLAALGLGGLRTIGNRWLSGEKSRFLCLMPRPQAAAAEPHKLMDPTALIETRTN
jgi:hypothetical protein